GGRPRLRLLCSRLAEGRRPGAETRGLRRAWFEPSPQRQKSEHRPYLSAPGDRTDDRNCSGDYFHVRTWRNDRKNKGDFVFFGKNSLPAVGPERHSNLFPKIRQKVLAAPTPVFPDDPDGGP